MAKVIEGVGLLSILVGASVVDADVVQAIAIMLIGFCSIVITEIVKEVRYEIRINRRMDRRRAHDIYSREYKH